MRIMTAALAAFMLLMLPARADTMQERDVKNIVANAVDRYMQVGPAAFDEISDPTSDFVRMPLYVFVVDAESEIMRAHGANQDLIGKVTPGVDTDGMRIATRVIEAATRFGNWVEYDWENPTTKMIEPKRSWVVLRDGLVFGAGLYK